MTSCSACHVSPHSSPVTLSPVQISFSHEVIPHLLPQFSVCSALAGTENSSPQSSGWNRGEKERINQVSDVPFNPVCSALWSQMISLPGKLSQACHWVLFTTSSSSQLPKIQFNCQPLTDPSVCQFSSVSHVQLFVIP